MLKEKYFKFVYGETGTKPLSIEIKVRMISFWAKLIITNHKKLSTEIYSLSLSNFKFQVDKTYKIFLQNKYFIENN